MTHNTKDTAAAIADIALERSRQVNEEGWTPEHDDQHTDGSLATAAAVYATNAGDPQPDHWPPPLAWPWDAEWWKPKDHRRDLVRAGALIVAEIERLDRIGRKELNHKDAEQ